MVAETTVPGKGHEDWEGQIPRWKCHKVVRAAKIMAIERPRREQTAYGLVLDNGLIACVNQAWIDKHGPRAGGYYVLYEDQYQSYSPAGPFEAGYTRLGQMDGVLGSATVAAPGREATTDCGWLAAKPMQKTGKAADLLEENRMNEGQNAVYTGNQPMPTGCDFGWALRRLKAGARVARQGWNGKGMYLWLLPATKVKAEWCKEPHLKALAEAKGGEIEAVGSIRMLTADGKILTGWLASQTDMLAEDWWEVVVP